ncbi:DUF58 domain-containing protein [Butyrivibrio proteoclasticus]|uniref:DUF58 domain-containing protein n=1 Tax=Butyrivibrio proteoclasticus TaxID=43305 RepID=UPI00047DCD0E|nr:DUF58 domain-containing protein [Butyrivibrio proteoclasticus]
MKIKIHRVGLILYLIELGGSLTFSSFYGGPVSYALLYGVLLIIPISIIYIVVNYHFLRIYQEIEVHKLTKGEEHRFRASFDNAGILPIHRMKIFLYSDRCNLFDIADGQEISLSIFEKKELTSIISCRYAGAYYVGIEKVAFTDPFGIFTLQIDIPYSFRAIVSPRITHDADRILDIENIVNNSGFKSDRLYEDIPGSDVRPYQKGDSYRQINWKVSARLNDLYVRIPDRMEKRTVSILMQAVDVKEIDQDIEFLKQRDQFLEFAVSIAWHFGEQMVPVKIIYPSGKITEYVVDSYDSFLEFYNLVADGIFYSSDEDYNKLQSMTLEAASNDRAGETCIIIREDRCKEDDYYLVCG